MNKKVVRVMDANVNRAAEGLRVVEDLARFRYSHPTLPGRIKELRHQVRAILESTMLISAREVQTDPGKEASFGYKDLPDGAIIPDERSSELELIHANFKRVQEALRSLEESSKMEVGYGVGKSFERLRFQSYQLEHDYHKELWQLKFLKGIYGITHHLPLPDLSNPVDSRCPTDHIEQIRRMVRCGIEVVQLRDKSGNQMSEEKKDQFRRLSHEIRGQGVIFIVNDDWKLAMELEASGVHFGQEDLQKVDITQIPEELLIGISTHNPDQVAEAKALGADYIGVGPVFETETKKDVEKSEGLKFLKWVSEYGQIPYVAIGGIGVDKLPQLRENGMTIAAMISAISKTESDNGLRELVKKFGRRRG